MLPSVQVPSLTSLRVVFVDDEAANCRLGLRMLTKAGVTKDNIVFLSNGLCSDKSARLFLVSVVLRTEMVITTASATLAA